MKPSAAARRALSAAVQLHGAPAIREVRALSGASQASVYRFMRGDSMQARVCTAIGVAVVTYLESHPVERVRIVAVRETVSPGPTKPTPRRPVPPAELALRRAELLGRIATCAAPVLRWDTARADAWLPGLKAALEDLRYEEEQHGEPEPLVQEAIKATTPPSPTSKP